MNDHLDNLIQRLKVLKDIDPFNKQLLNDCYDTVLELRARNETLERQLNELTGIKYDI